MPKQVQYKDLTKKQLIAILNGLRGDLAALDSEIGLLNNDIMMGENIHAEITPYWLGKLEYRLDRLLMDSWPEGKYATKH